MEAGRGTATLLDEKPFHQRQRTEEMGCYSFCHFCFKKAANVFVRKTSAVKLYKDKGVDFFPTASTQLGNVHEPPYG